MSSNVHLCMQYGWVCPVVVCPAIPDTCETVEYFIMEHGHTTVGGQRVTVQCQSCEYCMDFPQQSNTDSARRGRRNANHHRRHVGSTIISSICHSRRSHNCIYILSYIIQSVSDPFFRACLKENSSLHSLSANFLHDIFLPKQPNYRMTFFIRHLDIINVNCLFWSLVWTDD